MKFRRAKILAVIMLFAISIAPAAAQVMTGCEIRKAFSGNTVDGAWGAADPPYRQYFDPSGSTQASGHPSQGVWWTKGRAYGSSWPPSNAESCYERRRVGDRFLGVAPGDGALYPSTLLPGNQVQWRKLTFYIKFPYSIYHGKYRRNGKTGFGGATGYPRRLPQDHGPQSR